MPFTRNGFRNESLKFLNLRLQWKLDLKNGRKLIFSADVFNIFNWDNIELGGTTVTNYCAAPVPLDCGFGAPTNPNFLSLIDQVPPRTRAGQLLLNNVAGEPRQIQVGRPSPVLATDSGGSVPRADPPYARRRYPSSRAFFRVFSNLWTPKTGSFAGSLSFDPEDGGERASTRAIIGGPPSPGSCSPRLPPGRKRRQHRWRSCQNDSSESCRVRPSPGFGRARFRPSARSLPEPRPNPLASPPPDTRPVLELSLDDAVKRTLENNADIAVERYNPESSDYNVRQLKGYYEPYLISTIGDRSQTLPATNAFTGAERLNNKRTPTTSAPLQAIPTGGTFELDFNNNRQATNSIFSTFNPSFTSNFNLSLTQPLLRNLKVDSTRYQIKVAKKSHEISDVQFHQTVVNTVANVKQSYYDLIYALDNLDAQRKSLGLAQQLLEENRIKVRVGTMAPLDVVAAQSEVAGREANVIQAEASVADAEDVLKRAMFTSNEPESWNTRIVPTDRPTADQIVVDLPGAIQTAL